MKSKLISSVVLGVSVALVLAQLSVLTLLPYSPSYQDKVQPSSTRELGRKGNISRRNVTNGFAEVFNKYCNEYPDLQAALCGGTRCRTQSQASKCKNHWDSLGRQEGRKAPSMRQKPEEPSALSLLRSDSKYIHKETAAMCVIVKNEEAYLDEFVDYYQAIGFEKIYVYDNSLTFDLRQWAIQRGTPIQVIHFPKDTAPQNPAYLDCAQRAYQAGHTWAAFFDADEFLVLKKHRNVVSFLKEYCKSGALSINWVIMGTSEQLAYSPQPMTKRFRFRTSGYPEVGIKTIVRLEHMDLTREPVNPHWVFLEKGYSRKTTDGRECDGPGQESGPADVALLYHFRFKSYKEHIQKRERGRADLSANHPEVLAELEEAKAGNVLSATVYDDTVWTAMKKFVPKYRAYEQLFSYPKYQS